MAPLFYRVLDNRNPSSIANALRRRRAEVLREMVTTIVTDKGRCRIIDFGGTRRYWDMLGWPASLLHTVEITLVNLHRDQSETDGHFCYLEADIVKGLDVQDFSYDLCHSNSVIEHVGAWAAKKAFAAEVRRIAPAYYVQTPDFYFPIEPHFFCPFFHWLPKPARTRLVRTFSLGWYPRLTNVEDAIAAVEDKDLLTTSYFRVLFPDAEIRHERVALISKSLIAIRNGTDNDG